MIDDPFRLGKRMSEIVGIASAHHPPPSAIVGCRFLLLSGRRLVRSPI
jgi:hypothetical protein